MIVDDDYTKLQLCLNVEIDKPISIKGAPSRPEQPVARCTNWGPQIMARFNKKEVDRVVDWELFVCLFKFNVAAIKYAK